jgi:hypothetical protein
MNEETTGAALTLIAACILFLSAIPLAMALYEQDRVGIQAFAKMAGGQQAIMKKRASGV